MKLLTTTILVYILLPGAGFLGARQVDPSKPPPPPPPEAADRPAAPPTRAIDPAEPPLPPPADAPPEPKQPAFDPLHAQRSLDVGTFYMKKGNYDAAIDRFQEAASLQPRLAKPWVLLGETYEKKHDPAHALESYKKYLQLYPDAPDAAKVQKRIAELEEKSGPESSKQTSN